MCAFGAVGGVQGREKPQRLPSFAGMACRLVTRAHTHPHTPGRLPNLHAAKLAVHPCVCRHAPAGHCWLAPIALCRGHPTQVGDYLSDTSIPIWKSLAARHTEVYRDIRAVFCGASAGLEAAFGAPGPFWGRVYLFWHKGKPLCAIHEVFSPALGTYLGPYPACISARLPPAGAGHDSETAST